MGSISLLKIASLLKQALVLIRKPICSHMHLRTTVHYSTYILTTFKFVLVQRPFRLNADHQVNFPPLIWCSGSSWRQASSLLKLNLTNPLVTLPVKLEMLDSDLGEND